MKKENDNNKPIPKGNTSDPSPVGYATKRISEKTLDDYIGNSFGYEIYQDLSEGDNKDVFEKPIDFFHLLDE